MTTVLLALVPLVVKAPNPADVKPGWLGLAVFLALAAATVLLWLSFRRQLGKINIPDDAATVPDERREDTGKPGPTP